MTDYDLLLVEIRAAVTRYLLKSKEDIPLVLRRLNRDLHKTGWQPLLNEWTEHWERLRQSKEVERKKHTVNRDARIVYVQRLRAKNAGVAYDLTVIQWKTAIKYFDGLCAYCREKPYEVLEHFLSIPLGGTTADNCVPACQACNNKKNKHAPSELLTLFPCENIHRINEFLAMQKTDDKNP